MGRDEVGHRTEPGARLGRFEIDLTSVCVRVGAIQLPFRLQHAFEEGVVAAQDASSGVEIVLEFHAPRALHGLKDFFAAHELRANDRVVLDFEATELRIEAIRRERSAAGKKAVSQRKVDRIRTTPAPDGASVHRFASDGSTDGATEAASERTTTDAGSELASNGGATPERPGARAAVGDTRVVRERIRGNAPASMTRPDFGAGIVAAARIAHQMASVRGDKNDGGAPGRLPRWEPLDVMAPPDGWPESVDGDPQDAHRSPGHAVVREVRRSRATYGEIAGQNRAVGESGQAGHDRPNHDRPNHDQPRLDASGTTRRETSLGSARNTEQRAADAQAAALERVVALRSAPQSTDRKTSPQRADGERVATPPRPIAQRVTVARLASSRPITQHSPMLSRSDDLRHSGTVPGAGLRSAAATHDPSNRSEGLPQDHVHGVRHDEGSDSAAPRGTRAQAGLAAELNNPFGAAPTGSRRFPDQGDNAAASRPANAAMEDGTRPSAEGWSKATGGFLGLRRRFGFGRSQDAAAISTEATSSRAASGAGSQAANEADPRNNPATDGAQDLADAFLDFEQAPGDGKAAEAGHDARQRPWLPNGEYRPRDTLTSTRESTSRAADGAIVTTPAATRSPAGAPVSSQPTVAAPAAIQPTVATPKSTIPTTTIPTTTSPTTTSPTTTSPVATTPVTRGPTATPTTPPSASSPAQQPRPEEALAIVEAYLARPDVPAIVRSELIAEVLGVATERIEWALVRIAEDRERVTRIRPGAYMVRRKPAAVVQADSDA